MVLSLFSFNNHAVDIRLDILPELRLKHLGNQPLESCPSILQFERHHLEAICPEVCNERGVDFVFRVHVYLIILGERVHKTQDDMAQGKVYELVNSWQWEAVLGARLVKVSVVDTHASLPNRLLYHHNVG